MTNIKALVWGIKHIAKNHHFKSSTNWKEDGCVYIMGNNIPTLCDVQMLFADLGIDKSYIYESEMGIEIEIPYDWFDTEKDKQFIGLCMWERKC